VERAGVFRPGDPQSRSHVPDSIEWDWRNGTIVILKIRNKRSRFRGLDYFCGDLAAMADDFGAVRWGVAAATEAASSSTSGTIRSPDEVFVA
jgi:hypothetical protein